MFEWFKKPEYKNVLPFPKPETAMIPMPLENQPNSLDDSEAYYYLGKNKSGNVMLKVGYTTLTMTPDAVADMIEQLSVLIDDQFEITVKCIEDEQE